MHPHPSDFAWALGQLKAGMRVTRAGWKNVHYIALQLPDMQSKMSRPYIYAHDIYGDNVPWLASQVDLLEEDWSISTTSSGTTGTATP